MAASRGYINIDGDQAVWQNSWIAAGGEIVWNMVHYDVQLIGGMVLHDGKVAEMATGYLDGRVFMLYDDCPCLVYGPKTENIHGFDERVSLESIRQITHTIALFVAEWCGIEDLR